MLLLVLSACGPKSAGRPAGEGGAGDGGAAGGGHSPASDGGARSGLRIDPMDQEVTVTDQPLVIEYKALLVETATDVTAEATWVLDDSRLGAFSGSRLTVAPMRAGKTTVRAGYRGASGMTTLTVRQQKVVLGPGATAGAPGRFGGGAVGPAPTVVYPTDGVIVPQNMNLLELHFRPGARQDLFRLQLKNDSAELDIYFSCMAVGGGCVYSPDEATWTLLASGARGGTYRYTLAGVDPAGAIGTSPARSLAFSEEPITGGLYYWNAGGGRIQRYDFGLRTQNAEAFLDPPRAGALACVGCHALSRDGKKMAVGTDFPGIFKVFDVATRTSLYPGMPSASFYSFSPDATQLLAADGAAISLVDAMTGLPTSMPLLSPGTMPDWSPDGDHIVYTRPQTPPIFGVVPSVSDGSIALVTRSGGGFGAPTILVPYASGQNAFYPAFSPDGRLVAFNRSSGPSFSDNMPTMPTDKTVWIVGTAGGAPIRLGASTSEDDSWPKWAPDVQRYRGGSLMWLTFSSRRAYGLRQSGTPQLWMTAIDPAKAAMGADPSAPAFWLPFQDPASGNHIAQWVTRVERMDCTADAQCPGEFCVMGKCLPAPG